MNFSVYQLPNTAQSGLSVGILLKHFCRGFKYTIQVALYLGAVCVCTGCTHMKQELLVFSAHQTIFSFLYTWEIHLFFFACINRNIIFVISKKFTSFQNYFCKNPLSASLQKCSKS